MSAEVIELFPKDPGTKPPVRVRKSYQVYLPDGLLLRHIDSISMSQRFGYIGFEYSLHENASKSLAFDMGMISSNHYVPLHSCDTQMLSV